MKAFLLLFPLLLSSVAYGATSGKNGSSGSSQGELTVTATVVASIGLIIGTNGEQKYIVANVPDLQREPSTMIMENARPNAAQRDPVQRDGQKRREKPESPTNCLFLHTPTCR